VRPTIVKRRDLTANDIDWDNPGSYPSLPLSSDETGGAAVDAIVVTGDNRNAATKHDAESVPNADNAVVEPPAADPVSGPSVSRTTDLKHRPGNRAARPKRRLEESSDEDEEAAQDRRRKRRRDED
jgi:hypothetical protein